MGKCLLQGIWLLSVSLLSACGSSTLVKEGTSLGPPRVVAVETGEEMLLPLPSERSRLLYFWDTDCPRGLRGLRELAEKKEQLKKFEIIAINLDSASRFGQIEKYFRETSQLIHAFSGNAGDDQLFRAVGGTEVPLYVVLDKRGVVKAVGTHLSSVR